MLNVLDIPHPCLSSTDPEVLEKIFIAQSRLMGVEQLHIQTDHLIHAGMYARTVTLPPQSVFIGALIKVPTMVITVGTAFVLVGEHWVDVNGYQVLPASARRKQIFISKGPCVVTMLFPTRAKTIEDVEAEFTDENELLLSRKQEEMQGVVITGEQ